MMRFSSSSRINGEAGNDFIYNIGQQSTVSAGLGNDTIRSGGGNYTVEYADGDGNDIIDDGYRYHNKTIYITDGAVSNVSGSGDDVILKISKGSITLKEAKLKVFHVKDSSSDNYYIFDGQDTIPVLMVDSDDFSADDAGNYIFSENSNTTIKAGAGHDTIRIENGSHTSINAGAGNDSISYSNWSALNGGNQTIVGGKGNDTISDNFSSGLLFQYEEGDGKDVILSSRKGSKDDVAIQLISGEITNAKADGEDIILSIGSGVNAGSITLKNLYNYSIINVQKADGTTTQYLHDGQNLITDFIYNTDEYSVIGTDNADYIYNNHKPTYIGTGAGNDTIVNNALSAVIDAGSDDNFIKNYHSSASIKSGSGNDVINVYRNSDATISPGSGNNIINYYSDNSKTYYQYNGGKDVINLHGAFGGTIELDADTSITDYKVNGNNHTIELNNGSITINDLDPFVGMSNEYGERNGGELDNLAKVAIKKAKSDGSYEYTRYVNGRAFNDFSAEAGYTWSYFSDKNTSATSGDDYIYLGSEESKATVNAGDGDDYLIGDYLFNSQYNGGAGNDTIFIKDSAKITIDGGDGDDVIKYVGGSYYDDNDIRIGKARASINGGDGNDLIEVQAYNRKEMYRYEDSENVSVDDDGDKGKKITITAGKGNDTIRNTFINAPTNYNRIFNYSASYGDEIDTIIAHPSGSDTYIKIKDEEYFFNSEGNYFTTIVSALIYDRVIEYAEGDGDDVVEDYHETDTIQLINNPEYTMETVDNDVLINVGDGSIKLLNAKGKNIFIGDPKDNPYVEDDDDNDTVKPEPTLDKVTITNKDKSPYTATSMVGTIDGAQRTKAITINANSHNNSIVGGSSRNVINGGDGNDTIIGGKSADKLNGDAGNDILNGGKGNDTLTGGAGSDTFFYADGDGKDVIADYAEGEDVIKLTSGSITKATASKGDLTLTIGKGSIKLKSGVGKRIKVTDSSDNILFNQSFGDKTIKVTNSDADLINSSIDSVVVTIDSSERTTAVDLIGNAKANVFNLGSGNTTIETGKGKDTVIVGERSKVTITDYTAGQDKLKLSTDLTAASLSGSDVILGAGNASITLKDAKGKKITVIDKDGGLSSQVYGEKIVTITNSDGNAFKAMSGVEVLDASKRSSSKPITLTANDEGTTLIGGKGKDTLIGGAGADTFVYTKGGNVDLIKNYAADDVIKLGAKTSVIDAAVSGNDFILTIGGKKLTVEGGASIGVTVLNDSNIKMVFTDNSRTTKAFAELIEDNNLINNADNLTSILNDNNRLITTDNKFNEFNHLTLKSSLHTSLVLPVESSKRP